MVDSIIKLNNFSIKYEKHLLGFFSVTCKTLQIPWNFTKETTQFVWFLLNGYYVSYHLLRKKRNEKAGYIKEIDSFLES
jgi:hypothetical protein